MTDPRVGPPPATEREPVSSRRRVLRGVGIACGMSVAGCLETVSERRNGRNGGDGPDEGDDDRSDDDRSDDDRDDPRDPIHSTSDTREVRIETLDGDRLGSVTAAIADRRELRYTGLSDTESLPEDRGMLFVYDAVGDRTFVMREMAFGIDIVYADADGVITRIHHAPAPGPDEDGETRRYPGRGRYVLEVSYRWTAERDVDVGDVLRFGSNESNE